MLCDTPYVLSTWIDMRRCLTLLRQLQPVVYGCVYAYGQQMRKSLDDAILEEPRIVQRIVRSLDGRKLVETFWSMA